MKLRLRYVFMTSFTLGMFLMACSHLILTRDGEKRQTSLGKPQVVEKDIQNESPVIMNDPSMQKNWGLMGTRGQSDILANKAWDISQGDRTIVVAIIDTGIDSNHPDLKGNLWVNKGETGLDKMGRNKSTNGVDDDGDGFVDDVNGYDFVFNTGRMTDYHGHGTHIAGIIGAVGGNGIGIVGVSPKVSMMILKYFDPTSRFNDTVGNVAKAIHYAVDHGANIINYSGGGIDPFDEEYEAVRYAKKKGVLFVAAAGNEQSNSDYKPYYPADYKLDNIISVTAINTEAEVLQTSNFGLRSVHLAAPGDGIFSTLPGGQYGYLTGTSQATAFVTGVASLIMAHNKDFSYSQVKQQIIATADPLPGLLTKTSSGGKLNSWAALAIQPEIPATGIAQNMARTSAGVMDSSKPFHLKQILDLANQEKSNIP